LGWSQRDLEVRAKVSRKAIADFEREASSPYPRTIRDIIETLEASGIVFQEQQEGVVGPGVALRWGVEPKIEPVQGDKQGSDEPNGLSSAPWDDEFEDAGAPAMPDADRASLRRYYEDHPERWARLSPAGKTVLAKAMRLNDSSTAL
jgi:transcriptional regulator with XRE-family HTH domain